MDVQIEWGFRTSDGKVTQCPSRVYAERMAYMKQLNGKRVRPGAVVVSRTVTPWVASGESAS